MIKVFADEEELARAAAALVAEKARDAVVARGRCCIALAGGSTPRRTYELLALPPHRARIPWERLHVFWGDERCVPPTDPRSNARMAREALLDHVPLPAAQLHPIDCAGSPDAAALEYDTLLGNFFADQEASFDLVLLGLGADGHTASLFPGSAVVEERERRAAAVYAEQDALWRVTLTLPLLNRARTIMFLVSGAGKAPMVREVIEGTAEVPARLVRPVSGEPIWLVDREAARLTTSQAPA
jgi:6-phosphogluconolactonase